MNGVKRDCACPRARHRHGTWHAYANDRCRCEPCREAWATYTRDRRRRIAYASHRRWPLYATPHGTARRVQALATLGWSPKELAAMLGTAECVVADWRRNRPEWVYGATAEKVAALYDELWNTPSPGRYALKVRRLAAREGWLPPMALDDDTIDDPSYQPAAPEPDAALDEVAVQRIIDGTLHVGRNSRSLERIEAIRRLAAAGNEDAVIGQRIGMARDAVQRARLRAGIPAGVASNRKKAA